MAILAASTIPVIRLEWTTIEDIFDDSSFRKHVTDTLADEMRKVDYACTDKDLEILIFFSNTETNLSVLNATTFVGTSRTSLQFCRYDIYTPKRSILSDEDKNVLENYR